MKKRAKRQKPTRTKSGLAAALGISRQLLAAHLKRLGDGAPALDDLAAWELVLSADGREGSGPPELRAQIAGARLRLLSAAADREHLRLTRERGDVLDKAEVEKTLRRAVATFFAGLDREFLGALPGQVAHGTVHDAARLFRDSIERFKERFRTGLQGIAARSNRSNPHQAWQPLGIRFRFNRQAHGLSAL